MLFDTRGLGPIQRKVQKVSRKARTSSSGKRVLPQGEVRVRVLCVKFVGSIAVLLTAGGLTMFFIAPEQAKAVWPSIQPILIVAVSGMLGFWAGVRKRTT